MNASNDLMYIFPNHHFHDHTGVHHNGNLIHDSTDWLSIVFHFSVLCLILQGTSFLQIHFYISNYFEFLFFNNSVLFGLSMRTFVNGLQSIFLNYSLESLDYFSFPPTEVWSSHFSQDRKKYLCCFILNPLHENSDHY